MRAPPSCAKGCQATTLPFVLLFVMREIRGWLPHHNCRQPSLKWTGASWQIHSTGCKNQRKTASSLQITSLAVLLVMPVWVPSRGGKGARSRLVTRPMSLLRASQNLCSLSFHLTRNVTPRPLNTFPLRTQKVTCPCRAA